MNGLTKDEMKETIKEQRKYIAILLDSLKKLHKEKDNIMKETYNQPPLEPESCKPERIRNQDEIDEFWIWVEDNGDDTCCVPVRPYEADPQSGVSSYRCPKCGKEWDLNYWEGK